MDKIDSVSIRPTVGFYRMIPALPYKKWVALGEMVDNSIQSFDKNKEQLLKLHGPKFKLVVEISFHNGDKPWIEVSDNAAGIPDSEFGRAFTPAAPPSDKSGISQYGIGMKSSACWFSKNFFVRTMALGETSTKTVHFDIPKILKLEQEDLDVSRKPKSENEHGTTIELHNLLQPIPLGTALWTTKNYLKSIYREWLRSGQLTLIVAGETLTYESPKWLREPFWPTDQGPVGEPIEWIKNVNIELTKSWDEADAVGIHKVPPRVTGYVAILEKGSTKTAGLSLIWKNKVVQGAGGEAESSEDLYRPSRIFGSGNAFEKQRIFGELDVSELRVTSFKDAINWTAGQEEELLDKLLDQINSSNFPLKKMAQNYRSTNSSNKIKKKVDDFLELTAETLKSSIISEGLQSQEYGQPILPVEEIEDEGSKEYETLYSAKAKIVLRPKFNSDIRIEVAEIPGDLKWLRVTNEKDEWRITMNRSHPFMNTFSNTVGPEFEPLLRLACAIGIAEIKGREAGKPEIDFIRNQINDLLPKHLSSKDALKEEI